MGAEMSLFTAEQTAALHAGAQLADLVEGRLSDFITWRGAVEFRLGDAAEGDRTVLGIEQWPNGEEPIPFSNFWSTLLTDPAHQAYLARRVQHVAEIQISAPGYKENKNYYVYRINDEPDTITDIEHLSVQGLGIVVANDYRYKHELICEVLPEPTPVTDYISTDYCRYYLLNTPGIEALQTVISCAVPVQ